MYSRTVQSPTPVFLTCDASGLDVNYSFMIVYGSELDADRICIIKHIYTFNTLTPYCSVPGLTLY